MNSKNKASVLDSEDWEMLYINGELKCEGHTLNEGIERVVWFLEKAREYNFDLEEIEWLYVSEEDQEDLGNFGSGHRLLSDYKGEFR